MPTLVPILGVAVIALVMGALVAAKVEQQLLNILRGRAFRLGKSDSLARKYFAEERRWIHSGAFVAGIGLIALSLMFVTERAFVGWIGVIAGLALMAGGIFFRIRRFQRADQRLSEH